MNITVKKLKTIDIEKLLNKHEIEVTIEEQKPHGARKVPYRIFLKNSTYRNPRSADFGKVHHCCFNPDDSREILLTLQEMLDWKVIKLPCGKEVGPYVVTCKHDE